MRFVRSVMKTEDRTRFRTPVGLAIIAYKTALGVSEWVVGVLLLIPSLDVSAMFHRLAAEEPLSVNMK